LARTATVDEVAACVREHGHVIIEKLVPVELMDRIEAELPPTGPNPLPTQPLLDIMSLTGPKKGL